MNIRLLSSNPDSAISRIWSEINRVITLKEFDMFTMPERCWKVIIALLLLPLTGCNSQMKPNNAKFEWSATENAPKHYPMEIIQGTFYYKGEKDLGLYIPGGGTLKAAWGKFISSQVSGDKFKSLPDRLKITFFLRRKTVLRR